MLKKVRVEDAGDTNFIAGQSYDKNIVLFENDQIKKRIAADLAFEHYARFAGSDKMSVDDFVSTFPYFNDPYYIEIYIQTVDNYL
jgi:hypothetical protein